MTAAQGGSPDIPDQDHGKKVVLLENTEDIPSFLRMRERVNGPLQAVSASPGVSWALEKKSIPFTETDSYLDAREIHRQGIGSYEIVESICSLLDSHLEGALGEFSGLGLRPGTDNFFFTKLLYDSIALRISVVNGIHRAELPGEIVASCPGTGYESGVSGSTLPFAPDERIYYQVLTLPGWPFRASPIEVPVDAPPAQRKIQPGSTRRNLGIPRIFLRLGRSLQYISMGRSLGEKLDLAYRTCRGASSPGKRLLTMGYGYNWHSIAPYLTREGYQLSCIPGDRDRAGGVQFPVGVSQPPGLASLCRHENIGFTDLFWARLSPLLGRYLGSLPSTIGAVRDTIGGRPAGALLCGTKSRYVDHVQAHVARSSGIPVISWQHGAAGYFPWQMEEHIEFSGTDLHLCFGEGVREAFGEIASRKYGCGMVPVGSYELERISQKGEDTPREYDVLYATTNYYRNNLYVSGPSLFSDTDLWRTQRSILGVLGKTKSPGGLQAALREL